MANKKYFVYTFVIVNFMNEFSIFSKAKRYCLSEISLFLFGLLIFAQVAFCLFTYGASFIITIPLSS